jgi:hypothetical protein
MPNEIIRRMATTPWEKGTERWWGIQPWFAPTQALAEEITASLLHKAYQLITLEKRRLPRRFVEGDI